MICRTLAEIYAAADRDSLADPPLTQEQVDRFAVILAPYRRQPAEPQAA